MKFYLSEKGISKAMAKRLAILHVKILMDSKILIDEDVYVDTPSYLEYWKSVKTEIENYKFKK